MNPLTRPTAANLDAYERSLRGMRTFTRKVSHTEQPGYHWNPMLGCYEENDELFRARLAGKDSRETS